MLTTALRRHRYRTQRDERGSAIIIALVMVFIIGLIVAAVLSYAGSGLTANAAVSSDSRAQNAAEGAIEAAMQNIRNAPGSQNMGYTDGGNCGLNLPSQGASLPAAVVTCTPHDVSSQPGTGGNGSTSPGSAILTLGQRASEPGRTDSGFLASLGFGCFAQYPYNWDHDRNCNGSNIWRPVWFGGNPDPNLPPWGPIPEPGIMFQASTEKQGKNTGPVVIQGPIYDNSTIATYSQFNLIDQPDVNGNSGIHVRQPCAPSGGSTIGTDTNSDGTIDTGCVVDSYANTSSNYNDPQYPYRGQLSGVPFPTRVTTLPTCGVSTLVKFSPGWYDNATALDNLFESPACQNKDFWFQPGLYYFDFRNLTSIPAFCDNSGNQQSSTPGASAANIDDVLKYGSLHEWCVRASTKGSANHPHIVGGTPGTANADWATPNSGAPVPIDPSCIATSCSPATTSAFQPEANGRVSETIHGTTPVATAVVNVATGTLIATPVTSTKAGGATSSQVSVPGTDDFTAVAGDYLNSSSTWPGGTAGTTVNNETVKASTPPAVVTSGGTWTNTGNSLLVDGAVSTSPTITMSGSATLTVGGMQGVPAIPAGATITAVTISGASGLDSSSTWNSPTLTVTSGACSHVSTLTKPPTNGVLTAFTISVAADISANLACLNTGAKLSAATFKYTASKGVLASSGKATFDGVQLSVSYTLPGTTDTAFRKVNLGATPQIAPNAATTLLNSATLSVQHREQGAAGTSQLVITGTLNCTVPLTRVNQAGLGTDNINLMAAPCNATTAQQLDGAVISYQANNTGGIGVSVTAQFGGATLAASYTDTATKSAQVGFAPGLAAAALPSAATLDIAHSESGGMNPTVVVTTSADATTCTFTTANGLTSSSAMHVDHLDIYNGCLTTVAEINGARANFQVHAPSGVVNLTSSLDGMQLQTQVSPAPSRAVFPGGCDPNGPGVQFVFGGDSRMYMPDGDMELCSGPPVGSPGPGYTQQQIAVYGIAPVSPMSPNTVVTNSASYPFCALNTGGVGQPPCDPNGTLKIDDVTQDASGNVQGDYGGQTALLPLFQSTSIKVANFGPAPVIPAGMHVAKVLAQVDHWEQGATISFFTSPQIQFGNGTSNCGSSSLTVNGNLNPATQFGPADDTVDLTSCYNSTLAATNPALWTATFSASNANILSGAYTEHLDGIRLIVELEPNSATQAVYAPENGCVAGIGSYPNYWDGISDTDCALLKWDSIGPNATDQKAQVSIHGTVYAPGAAIDVDDQGARCTSADDAAGCLTTADPSGNTQPCAASGTDSTYCFMGVNYPIFDRGIIVRHLRFKAFLKNGNTPVISCGGPFCGATASPKQVTLTATVNGATRITAEVCFGPVTAGVCGVGTGTDPPQIMSWQQT